ncbi:SRPBCC family protein [Acinetobacter baumannii]|uniref:SRPBCC family protein n=1 Tax=Acinetobacter calcoaceticus/baumannii complex TaxID=909768 RepID=UPI00244D3D15|nr:MULTISPECIES: SRPBCC family protein [Acinetobacter calcoaceticus/baumannii complex]MDH2544577.1 SRPBCC family protein [Acinetobacter baumannii]MDO7218891.1 SRPBCC family protein [Acinetobacter nosocomialis]MDO7474006.1 SRPBCC family protein [Acinetobacter baumannii]
MNKIRVEQKINAPVSQVFPLFVKHSTFNILLWPIQSKIIKFSKDLDNPDGVGSIRKMGIGPIKFIKEEIISIVPHKRVEYKMIRNTLFFDHLGVLEFYENKGRTLLVYTIHLDSKIPLLATITLIQLRTSIVFGLKKISKKFN